MKILFTSVDAIFHLKKNAFFLGIEDVLDYFLSLNSENKVIVISSTVEKLELIPNRYHPIQVDRKERSATIISKFLKNNSQYNQSDVVILGGNDADLRLAANEKVLLLSAHFSNQNNPLSKIFYYGIKINDIHSLKILFDRFSNLIDPWYYRLPVDDSTILYSLTNAETKTSRVNPSMVYLNDKFRACLKNGQQRFRDLFSIYFLAASYSSEIINDFNEINYWSIYPSSNLSLNNDLNYFKELIRKSFNGLPKAPNHNEQVLERIKTTDKRQWKRNETRIT